LYKKRTRKGGNLTGLIAQAAAPVALIGAQHLYKPHTKKIYTRTNKKNTRFMRNKK